MGPRDVTRLYQTAARGWLTAALVSSLLPYGFRQGWWLPLHLLLAGAVTSAISGAMQNFTDGLTGAKSARKPLIGAQFLSLQAGAALIAVGRVAGRSVVLAVGGAAFVFAITLLLIIIIRARRTALMLRHPLPITMYLWALAFVLAGGSVGIWIGVGWITSGQGVLAARNTHMALNLLGFVSLTVFATLITLLPTVLRVRMPAWRGRATAWLLIGSIALLAAGLASSSSAVAVCGAVGYFIGLCGVGWMVARVVRAPRNWATPAVAKHLFAGLVWMAAGSLWLIAAVAHGSVWFYGAAQTFASFFALGWAMQVLLGAWLYLLPMSTPAHPDERRRFLMVTEFGSTAQLALINAGIGMLLLGQLSASPEWLSTGGMAVGSIGVAFALMKAWAFAPLSKIDALTRSGAQAWDPSARPPRDAPTE